MNAGGWWLADLRAEVSQGDAFADVPFSILVDPLTHLRFAEQAKGKRGWAESVEAVLHKTTQRNHALAALKISLGILLSHDCEIDKAKDRHRLLFTPIAPIANLSSPATQEAVLAQRHRVLVPVGEIQGQGQCYSDLRGITTIPAELVSAEHRVASMTDEGRLRLQGYLVSFLLRRVLPPPDAQSAQQPWEIV